MIAGRLELLLLLFIVVHGKVVTHCGVATNSKHICLQCSTHTTGVHTNSRRGSGHKQYTKASRSGSEGSSVYSTRHLSSAEDKNFPFCPQLRTQKTYGKQMLFSKPSTIAYLTMVVLPSWQLLTQY